MFSAGAPAENRMNRYWWLMIIQINQIVGAFLSSVRETSRTDLVCIVQLGEGDR